MSDEQNETIADIVAEMRKMKRYAKSDSNDCRYVAYWCYQTFADRIEAAWKRDELRWAKANGELAKMLAFENAQGGNAAAIREALEKIVELTAPCEGVTSIELQVQAEALTALSLPPRNCDVGTALEQSKRFMDFCRPGYRPPNCEECKVYTNRMNKFWCQLEWAQTPYAAKEGGVTDGVQSAS